MKKIITILCLFFFVFPVFVNGEEITGDKSKFESKMKFCNVLGEVAEHTMMFRQIGLSREDTKRVIMIEMSQLGMGGYQESEDMVDVFVSTAFMSNIIQSPDNEVLITTMGDAVTDRCISDLIIEDDFL
jgi:hypothetical protein